MDEIAQLLPALATTTPSQFAESLAPIGPFLIEDDWSGLLYGIEEVAHRAQTDLAEQLLAVCFQIAQKHENAWAVRAVKYFLGNVYFHQGKVAQAIEAYQTVVERGKTAADEDGLSQASLALGSIGQALMSQGRIPEAIAFIEESLALDIQLGQQKTVVFSRLQLANLYLIHEDFALVEAMLNQALEEAQKLNDPFMIALAWMRLGNMQLDLENPAQALEYYQFAMDALDSIEEPEDEDLYIKAYRDLYINLGTANEEHGKWGRAISAYSNAARLANILEDRRSQAVAITWLGHTQSEAGRPDLAVRSFDAAERLARSVDYTGWIGTIHFFRASALQALKLFEEAEAAVHQAIQHHRTTAGDNSPDEVGCLMKLGKFALEKGDPEQAIAWYRRALGLLHGIGVSQMHRLIYLRLGEAYWYQGEFSQAYEMLRQALDVYESKRQTVSELWSRVDFAPSRDLVYEYLVRTCLALGNIAEAFSVVEEGRMRVFLEQLATRAIISETIKALDWQDIKPLLCPES